MPHKDQTARRKNQNERQRRRRAKLRALVGADKASSGCTLCNETHPACLQFHHTDPSTKVFSISKGIAESRSVSAIKEEIAKCMLLCANCHAKAHS